MAELNGITSRIEVLRWANWACLFKSRAPFCLNRSIKIDPGGSGIRARFMSFNFPSSAFYGMVSRLCAPSRWVGWPTGLDLASPTRYSALDCRSRHASLVANHEYF